MFGYNTLAFLNAAGTPHRRVRSTRRESNPLNLYVGDESAEVTALIPGVDSNDVEITIEDRDLSITAKAKVSAKNENDEKETVLLGERTEGDFARKVRLPFRVEGDQVKAEVRNGVLYVNLPRAEADKPRRIKIGAA